MLLSYIFIPKFHTTQNKQNTANGRYIIASSRNVSYAA